MSANKDLTAKIEDGVMWIPATACPICGSLRAGCFSLESATPSPDTWCPELEDALEFRGWRVVGEP